MNNHSKNFPLALTVGVLILIVFVIGGFTWAARSQRIVACYIWNTEAGDHALLRLETAPAGGTEGSFVLEIAGKDRRVGNLMGTLKGAVADLIWTGMSEGMNFKEELRIRIEGSIAKPGFGEMVEISGIYKYKNQNSLTYPISLQKASCSED